MDNTVLYMLIYISSPYVSILSYFSCCLVFKNRDTLPEPLPRIRWGDDLFSPSNPQVRVYPGTPGTPGTWADRSFIYNSLYMNWYMNQLTNSLRSHQPGGSLARQHRPLYSIRFIFGPLMFLVLWCCEAFCFVCSTWFISYSPLKLFVLSLEHTGPWSSSDSRPFTITHNHVWWNILIQMLFCL